MKGRSPSLSTRTRHSEPPTRGRAKAIGVWTVAKAVEELARHGKRRNVEGMARFGIRAKKVLGVSKPKLDEIVREIGKDHELGLRLWETGIHDAHLLGMLISDPEKVTAQQMERWLRDFDNWDVCDGTWPSFVRVCPARMEKSICLDHAEGRISETSWICARRLPGSYDKEARDEPFRKILRAIERKAWDDRNFVQKAVNWGLRNIGKRNLQLNRETIACAERIRSQDTRPARWIAADALRELKSDAVQNQLRAKGI